MSSSEHKGISDLKLERYALGELPPPEREALARRLEQIRARLDAPQRREPAAARAPLHRLWPVSAALAAAAVAVVAIIPQLTDPNGLGPVGGPEPGVRVKGLEPQLSLHRRTSTGSETLSEGDPAHRGDLIRIGYQAAGRP